MADAGREAQVVPAGSGLRDTWWFRVLVTAALVVALVVAWSRFSHRDVVAAWELLATCPAASDAPPTPVSTALTTTSCTMPPVDPQQSRGWPIIAFALPADVGLDPSISTVHSDKVGRTLWLDYVAAAPGDGSNGREVVLVFIELPPHALPDVPFTVQGATGPVDVSAVAAG